ncbi:MAG: hypothetical protein DRN27_01360 [Thermoplasmata archaeon]|nr:MAG: hypothetical protein DRN27_01360 [Thermoplasmata archaeon]
MNKNYLKIKIFTIVSLFLMMGIIPSISGDQNENNIDNSLLELDTNNEEFFNIKSFISSLFSFKNTEDYSVFEDTQSSDSFENPELFPMMRVDYETFKEMKEAEENTDYAFLDSSLSEEISAASSYSTLDLLDYVPSERNQGWCGNCWAWPSTSVLSMALNVQEGIFDRLSVQYINSCGYKRFIDCCDGGTLESFASFYRYIGYTIPWSNDNAHWQDRYGGCKTDCESIATTPNYPISSIYSRKIPIHRVSEEEAIENIKNILHQDRGVYFSFFLPNSAELQNFNNFWSQYPESSVYPLDSYCGDEINEHEVAGHAVLCVGYNDETGTDNDYWIMLNSWGSSTRRPNGLFRINMHMNYNCNLTYNGNKWGYAFGAKTLNVTFGSEPENPDAPSINGPESAKARSLQYYEFSTTDHQGDDVYFTIDWGDGEEQGWIGPFKSKEKVELSHSWDKNGDFTIRAKSRDKNWKESDWSTLQVSMTKSKISNSIFFSFLENHPALHPLLEQFF